MDLNETLADLRNALGEGFQPFPPGTVRAWRRGLVQKDGTTWDRLKATPTASPAVVAVQAVAGSSSGPPQEGTVASRMTALLAAAAARLEE